MLKNLESYSFSTNPADFLTYGRATYQYNDCQIFPTGGAYGVPCLNFYGAADWRHQLIGGSGALGTVIHGTRATIANASSGVYIYFYDAVTNTPQVTIAINGSSQQVVAYRGTSGGTSLGSSALGVFPLAAWFYVEMLVTVSSSVGVVTVRINGANVLTLTGLNTQNTARAFIDQTQYDSQGGNCSFQDAYWCDNTGSYNNTFLGDCRVSAKFPSSAGSTTNFTSSNANADYVNAAMVPPGGDSDYNYDSTVGDIDLYNVGAPSLISTVFGVQASIIARKDAAATRSIATLIKSASTTTTGATIPLSTGYTTYQQIAEVDPATGVAWLPAALACQIGAKVAA